MGDTKLETRADDTEKAAYQVIAYPSASFPNQYRHMILSKWMRSLRYENSYFKLVNSDSYYAAYQRYIASLLARPNGTLRLAVLSDDHDVVLGWSLTERSTLHYVWVAHEQRNKSIAKSLVPILISKITHLTNTGMRIWNSKLPDAIFDPF
jgi:hypothetical protein